MANKDDFLNYINTVNLKLDLELIGRAFTKGEEAHTGQMRKSGEEYFIHPIEVSKILAELEMDSQTIAAGLLHDVIEDTDNSYEQIKQEFGEEVAVLVDGVSKLGTLVYETKEERQAENLRKMFLAMSKDIRVLIIKLADRLHNMRTLNYMTDAKIQEKCNETLEIYAPLAHRLGISKIKFELEDLALKYLDPQAYDDLVEQIKTRGKVHENHINEVITELKEALKDLNIEFEITGRYKHYYSIYKKMKFRGKQLEEIFDLTAIRIIVDSLKDCYGVLGIVHTMWKPIPGRFKDYIAMPKPNMYQSIHTTVIANNGEPFEIQIRTHEMHQIAEYGIAAHWKYKEGISASSDADSKLAWLRQMMEWQKDLNDPSEFMETLKVDLFSNQVFVFTPKGDVIELPAGSTPIDFAYKIHSAVGDKCTGAKVNGKMVPIDHVLDNGNIIEIVTSSNSKGPNFDWLKIAKSTHAKNKIRNFLRKENKSENLDKGRELIEKQVKRKGYDTQLILKQHILGKATKYFKLASVEELYISVGYGGIPASKVSSIVLEYAKEEKQIELKKNNVTIEDLEKELDATGEQKKRNSKKEASGVSVRGVDNLLIRFSKCCSPVPGDDIIGFITKGRGISVHRADCINMVSLPEEEKNRLIDVEWNSQEETKMSFETEINILAEDRKGLLSEISKLMDDIDADVTRINAKTGKDKIATIGLTINISNTEQLDKILKKLKVLEGVVDVYRSAT